MPAALERVTEFPLKSVRRYLASISVSNTLKELGLGGVEPGPTRGKHPEAKP